MHIWRIITFIVALFAVVPTGVYSAEYHATREDELILNRLETVVERLSTEDTIQFERSLAKIHSILTDWQSSERIYYILQQIKQYMINTKMTMQNTNIPSSPVQDSCLQDAITQYEEQWGSLLVTTMWETITFTNESIIYLEDEWIVASIELYYAPCPEWVMCAWSWIGYVYKRHEQCTTKQRWHLSALFFDKNEWRDYRISWKRDSWDHQTYETGSFSKQY